MNNQTDNIYLKKYLNLLNLNITSFEKIAHEEALSSKIYKLKTSDQNYLILKIAYNKQRYIREKHYLNLVKNSIPVPRVLKTLNPQENLNPAILMDYVDGNLIDTKSITDKLIFEMGALLAKVHSIKCDFYEDVSETEKLEPSIENGKKLLKQYFETSLAECKNYVDSTILSKIENYFYKNFSNIKFIDGPHLVHRDFKPGNIIIKDGKIKALIDWEISKNSFAEEDFASVNYLVFEKHPHLKKGFFEGYESIRKLPNLKEVGPLIRIAKALGAIGFTIERNTYKTDHKFIFDMNFDFLKRYITENNL